MKFSTHKTSWAQRKKEAKEQANESKSQENHGKNLFLAHKTENKFQDTKK